MVFSRSVLGKKVGAIALALVMVICLTPLSNVLAATVPSAPTNFTAVAGDGQVTLVWFAPESDGGSTVTKYQVSIDGGISWIDVDLLTAYTISGLTNGTTYTFAVRAVNSIGSGTEAITVATPAGSGVGNDPGSNPGQGQGPIGGQGPGGGTGSSDGDGPDVNWPPNPPDKPPTEVELPPDGSDADIKIEREKMKEMQFVWTIRAKGMDSQPDTTGFRRDITLEFEATKGPEPYASGQYMFGKYTCKGSIRNLVNEADVIAKSEGTTLRFECEFYGPLSGTITLAKYKEDKPMPNPVPDNDLASLVPDDGDLLAPLVPTKRTSNDTLAPLVNPPKARGKAALRWAASATKNYGVSVAPDGTIQSGAITTNGPAASSETVEIWYYSGSRVTIEIYHEYPELVLIPGSITRKTVWTDMQ